jgi:GDP-L-fucose synthase
MNCKSKIYVAGHTGMVGSAIVRCLIQNGYANIITRTHAELDLTVQRDVESFFQEEKPDYVFIASAKVGGILSNKTYPADYMLQNLMIAANIIQSAHLAHVKKLLFLGSSCIYPKLCPQPIREEYLLSGPLESSNEAYALAKIAGVRLCQHFNTQYGDNFIAAMPASIYGENDRYDAYHSHVIPAMIVKMHAAKLEGKQTVELWGTGTPLREFLYVDDLADACLFIMDYYNENAPVNIGTGMEISIRNLAEMVRDAVGYTGELYFDTSKPDGTPRKVLDLSKLTNLGWKPRVSFIGGIQTVYQDYLRKIGEA